MPAVITRAAGTRGARQILCGRSASSASRAAVEGGAGAGGAVDMIQRVNGEENTSTSAIVVCPRPHGKREIALTTKVRDLLCRNPDGTGLVYQCNASARKWEQNYQKWDC